MEESICYALKCGGGMERRAVIGYRWNGGSPMVRYVVLEREICASRERLVVTRGQERGCFWYAWHVVSDALSGTLGPASLTTESPFALHCLCCLSHGFSQRRLSMLGSDGRRYFFLVQVCLSTAHS